MMSQRAKLDEDYDGLPPPDFEFPTREELQLEDDLAFLIGLLDGIASGVEVAFRADSAISAVQSGVSKRGARISTSQRDKLLVAIALARGAIVSQFSSSREVWLANAGVDALVGLVCLWAEDDCQRAERHVHARIDMHAYARHLRNACHNLCLLDDIRKRQAERAHETVSALLARAAG